MEKNGSINIMIIGDVILDEYKVGSVNRISPESPVPIFNYKETFFRLGGAANVTANLTESSDVKMLSIIGLDQYSKKILELFKQLGVDTRNIICDKSRKTTVKTRLLADNHHVLRIDIEDTSEISQELEVKLFKSFLENVEGVDVVILSDYGKGVLTEDLTLKILSECRSRGKKTFVDVKGSNRRKYRKSFLLKPNEYELSLLVNRKLLSEEDIKNAMLELKSSIEAETILVTRSKEGYILLNEKNEFTRGIGIAKEVFDVTGAGDTFIAYLTLFSAKGEKLEKAAELANVAAGIKVSKVGTAPVSIKEIESILASSSREKVIIDQDYFIHNSINFFGKKIVFTNGCYDILHIGHLQYLKKASELGDIFIVGVNSDRSVRNIKGENRPILDETSRMNMLAEFDFIDYVVLFDEDTPYELIKKIKPHVLVKGGDYCIQDIVGRDIVESYGGEVHVIPFVEGYSTTGIINKIKQSLERKEIYDPRD